jgi:hypothetical protein
MAPLSPLALTCGARRGGALLAAPGAVSVTELRTSTFILPWAILLLSNQKTTSQLERIHIPMHRCLGDQSYLERCLSWLRGPSGHPRHASWSPQ